MPSVGRGLTDTWHALSLVVVCAEQRPTRTSLSSETKGASPCWRTTSVRVHVTTAAAAHDGDWKAKPA